MWEETFAERGDLHPNIEALGPCPVLGLYT